MSKIPVALQMYSVREEAGKDFVGALKQVAEIGYAGIETAGCPLSAKELDTTLKDLGLKPAGSHTSIDRLENELSAEIEFALEIGSKYLVCSYMPDDRRPDAAGWRSAAAALSRAGAECLKHGLQVCYHNHSFEFQKFDGQYGLDIFYEAADPVSVKAELDTYWIQHGGEDPVAYIHKLAGRLPLLHLKDMADDEARSFTEVGNGILDFDAIAAAAAKVGVEWFIVEQDICPGLPMDSVRISFKNLKAMGLA